MAIIWFGGLGLVRDSVRDSFVVRVDVRVMVSKLLVSCHFTICMRRVYRIDT